MASRKRALDVHEDTDVIADDSEPDVLGSDDESDSEGSVGSLADFVVANDVIEMEEPKPRTKRARVLEEVCNPALIVTGKRQSKPTTRWVPDNFARAMLADVPPEEHKAALMDSDIEDDVIMVSEAAAANNTSDSEFDEDEEEDEEDDDDDEEDDDEDDEEEEYRDEDDEDDEEEEEEEEEEEGKGEGDSKAVDGSTT